MGTRFLTSKSSSGFRRGGNSHHTQAAAGARAWRTVYNLHSQKTIRLEGFSCCRFCFDRVTDVVMRCWEPISVKVLPEYFHWEEVAVQCFLSLLTECSLTRVFVSLFVWVDVYFVLESWLRFETTGVMSVLHYSGLSVAYFLPQSSQPMLHFRFSNTKVSLSELFHPFQDGYGLRLWYKCHFTITIILFHDNKVLFL